MSLKSFAAKIFAKNIAKKTAQWVNNPIETQDKVFQVAHSQGKKYRLWQGSSIFRRYKPHSDFVQQCSHKGL